jgi:hypothetical protein
MTLEELCAGMAASGRPLTERAARDWWNKGLLPQPRRRGLGQGRGTETYWLDRRVAAQAEAAHDFLAMHARTYSAAVHLWLVGFPVELPLVRGAYRRMIRRHFQLMHHSDDPDGPLSALAARASRHMVKTQRLPSAIRDDLTDLVLVLLDTFFSINWGFEKESLSGLWGRIGRQVWEPEVSATLAFSDHQLEVAAGYFRRMGSLSAQREAIRSASDYELIRARRLVLLVLGYVRRIADLTAPGGTLGEFGRNFSIAVSRPAVPILVMVLREDWLRRRIIVFLLDAAAKFRQGVRSGEFAKTLAHYQSGHPVTGCSA